MNKNILIVLGGGVVIAVLVAVLVQASLSGSKEPAAVVEEARVQVLVASGDLKTGAELNNENMRWQSWPEGAVFSGAIVRKEDEEPADVVEGRLARPVADAEPIIESVLVKKEGTFLAAALEPGMRAVAIEVDAGKMAGGFIGPGDFVDVVMVYKMTIKPEKGDTLAKQVVDFNLDKYAVETVLQNVRVLAIDQTAKRDDEQVKVGRTVTLAVSQLQSERLTLASEMGDLTLVLRGLGDDDVKERAWPTVTDARMTNIYDEVYAEYMEKKNSSGVRGDIVRIYSGDMVQDVPTR